MSAPPYMKLFWGDYAKATRHLRHAREHGAYLLLIGALWDNSGRLPADDQTLADYALLSLKEWEALKSKLMPFFRIRRGFLTQDRVTEELAKYESTSCKRKQAGKSGGSARARNQRENSQAIAKQKPTYSESESEAKESPLPPDGGPQGSGGLDLGDQPGRPGGRRKAARPIPDDFPGQNLIDEQQAKARTAGADLDLAYQAERFRNWAIGKDARYADWGATWRNWAAKSIREAPKRLVSSTAQPAPTGDAWSRRVAEFQRNSSWSELDWGPRPGRPGCTVDPTTLREFGIEPAKPQPVRGAA